MNNLFNSILGTSFNAGSFCICLVAALILGLVVAFVHMKTSNYNKNFIVTLAVLPMIVSVVIMLVNGNLGTSVAIVGAFSLVRFRSIPGNSKEILAVFFAMAIGLAVGTGYLAYATVFTLFAALIIFVLYKVSFGENKMKEKRLTIAIPEDLDYTTSFDEIFNEYLKEYKLIKTKTTNMGSLFELTYEIRIEDNKNEKEFIDKIRVLNGNLKVMISHPVIEEEL
jgi:hypothetical protein